MSLACGIAMLAILGVALFSPPSPFDHWAGRLGALVLAGTAAGLMNMSVTRAAMRAYQSQPAATLNLGGVFWGVGCLISVLIVNLCVYADAYLGLGIMLVILPAVGCYAFARSKMPPLAAEERLGWRCAFQDLRSPSAILLSLLLFFQFGNEGAVSGWLALFLIQKLGYSPARGLFLLAFLWFTLLAGRLLAQVLLPRVRHGRMLVLLVLMGMFGCLILAFTDNLFGVVSGLVLCGPAFSAILPLVGERIGSRFPQYRPGAFNGIFSIALTGGYLAPASIGVYAWYMGINVVMAVPMIGSIAVLLIVMAMTLEARLNAHVKPA
jgi:fucose permease